MLGRIRAGVLEQVTVGLMERLGLDARLKAEGLPHDGFNLADGERLIRIDIAELTGKQVVVYGQTELTRDLMDAREERGLEVIYEAGDVALHDIESDAPFVTYTQDGTPAADRRALHRRLRRVPRPQPQGDPGQRRTRVRARVYPFGWLGILADVPPCNHELIYANHERGFALASMRSETRSRYYIDVPLTEKIEDWPRRARVGRTGDPPRTRGRGAHHARAGDREVDRAAALLRVRADAPRQPAAVRRCRAHRAADRRQGAQPRGERRALRRRGADRVLCPANDATPSPPIPTRRWRGCGRPNGSAGR